MNYIAAKMAFHAPRPLIHFPPPGGHVEAPDGTRMDWDNVCQEVWHAHSVAAAVLPHEAPACVALYCHGNAENLVASAHFVAQLREHCRATVFAIEYPGYFDSSEPASEAALKAAVSALVAKLAAQALPVLLVGYSLGSAAAVHAAGSASLRGRNTMLVLLAPLVGGIRTFFVTGGILSALVSPFDVFRTDAAAAQLSLRAAAVFHGTDDAVVPLWHGQRLAAALRTHTPAAQFWALPGTTHDTVRARALPMLSASVGDWLDATGTIAV